MKKNFLPLLLMVPLLAMLTSCAGNQQNQMNEKREAAFLKVNEILDSGDVDSLGNYLTDDIIDHQLDVMGVTQKGLAGVKQMFTQMHNDFTGMKMTVKSMAFTGDTMFAWVSMTATPARSFMGMPAGQTQTMENVDVVRWDGDKIAEHWGFIEFLPMMMQQQDTTNMMQ